MSEFLTINSITFLILGFIWSSKDITNFALKLYFLGMGCHSGFLALALNGYIIKK